MKDSLISIIVPVYKVEQLLPRCVDSLLAQTHRNLEILLVDDGSPDGCGAICDAYAGRDPRVKVIHKENGGLSSARNAGIDMARGEYLAFVDSDDWVEPQMYETMLSLAKKYDAPLVCAGRYDVDGKTLEKTKGLCPEKEEAVTGEELVRRIFLWDHLDSAAWDKLYARHLFRQIRYPHGRVIEDVPTTYRIALDAGKAVLCPRPFYNYFHREGSITTAKVSERTFHFSQHAELVYDDISQNHPGLEPEARFLLLKAHLYSLLMGNLAAPGDRETFRREFSHSRRQVLGQLPFLLKSPWFGRKERATALTMVTGIYRPLRQLRNALRRTP